MNIDTLSLATIRDLSTKPRVTKDLLQTALAACLVHYDALWADNRKLEMQLIETRATVQALNIKVEDDARVLRKITGELNAARRPGHVRHEFTLEELRVATDEYLEVFSTPNRRVRSVTRDALVAWLKAGKPNPNTTQPG